MITLTDLAKSKIKEISDAEGIGHYNVRVNVQGAGCAGYSINVEFVDKINDTDEVFEFDDTKIVIDCLSFQYLDGIIIDYKDDPFSAGFSFGGEVIKGTCGCNQSYEF